MVSAELAGSPPSVRSPRRRATSRVALRSLPDPPRVLLDRAFERSTLHDLRCAVTARLADLAGEQTAEVMVLVAHELSSNCVRHGGGTGRLRLWIAGGNVHCELSDDGPGITEPGDAGRSLPAPARSGGRGLWIARQLSELHITTGSSGTTITAVLPLH